MENFNTLFATEIVKGKDFETAMQFAMRQTLETTINDLLKHELTVFLDYEKYDPIGYNSGNSRNGYLPKRSIKTAFGEIEIEVPRDRNGDFNSTIIPNHNRNSDGLENMVIQLYRKGMTTREISDLIEKMYGHHYTPQTISNMTKLVEVSTKQFHQRKVGKRYSVVYLDATFINVRRDTVAKEALHIIVGINLEGEKEILDYQLYPSESASNYREMLIDLKERGMEEVLLFVTDGLTGLSETLNEIFPSSKHQNCWVHVCRNVSRQLREKDRKEVLDEVKQIYKSETKEEASLRLIDVATKFEKRYPKVSKILLSSASLLTFYDFPKEIRSSIYTTNLIEGFNKQIKKDTKRKEQFPNEESLDRFICVKCESYNQRHNSRIHKGFGLVRAELEALFN